MKEDFPVFRAKQQEPYVYLDSAATTHKPQAVIDAITEYYSSSYATVHRTIYRSSRNITEAYQQVREKVQQWIGASSPQEIVFTRGTTSALNLLAIAWNDIWHPGSATVLVSEVEHHAGILSWELACRRRGNHVKTFPVDDQGLVDLEQLENLLREGASLVCVHHVHNVTGCIQPIAEIARLAHAYGAYLVVDGAQGIAHFPVHVVDWDVDFYVFSGHKMYGPTGVGVLYGKKELLEKLPPVEGGGDMIATYDSQAPIFMPPPERFEAGTPPIASILGLGAAVDYLRERSCSHEGMLTQQLYTELTETPGVHIIGPRGERGALISMTFSDAHVLDVGFLLDCEGIAVRTGHQCSQPTMKRFGVSHVLRTSLGIYNDQQDIEQFLQALAKARRRLAS